MFHRQEIAVNKATGVPVPGVIVRLYDADSNPVSLYSDTNGTPIITVSGIANAAVADQAGNYSYYVNDGLYTERLYIGDAEFFAIPDLVCQGLVNFLQSGTGAAVRSVQDKMRDVVSVKDFGAVGDGTTDDYAAIQAALDSIDNSGGQGGTVLMPKGIFQTSATINIPTRVKLIGSGAPTTAIRYSGTGSAVKLADTDFAGVSKMRIIIGSASATAVGLELYSDTLWVQWCNFQDLEFTAGFPYTSGQKGIWCHSRDASTTVVFCQWSNIRVFAFHKPWVVDNYYEGNDHRGINIGGFGINSGDAAISFTGAACHWQAWIGKAASSAPSLTGISYADLPGNNRFKVTADIGTGFAMKLISGSMPTGVNANQYEVQCTQGVTSPGDVVNYAPMASGTFTPAIVGTTTAGAGTYTTQQGAYSRIGDRMFIDVVIDWTAHTGTGNIKIGGLPQAALGEPLSLLPVLANGLTITGQPLLLVDDSATTATLYAENAGSIAAVAMDQAATLRFTGSYRVAI